MLIGQSLGNILHTAEISSLMHVQNIHIYGKSFTTPLTGKTFWVSFAQINNRDENRADEC